MIRPFAVRFIASLLVLYGIAGIGGSLWAVARVSELFADARSVLSSSASADSVAIARTIARTLGSAADATSSGNQSLARAQESLRSGATSADELADAVTLLALAVSFDVFGARPLADVAGPLGRSSQRLESLATALNETERSLEASRRDVAELGGDLRDLQAEASALADRLAAATDAQVVSRAVSNAEWLSNIALVGFGLQSAFFLMIGVALFLMAPRRVAGAGRLDRGSVP